MNNPLVYEHGLQYHIYTITKLAISKLKTFNLGITEAPWQPSMVQMPSYLQKKVYNRKKRERRREREDIGPLCHTVTMSRFSFHFFPSLYRASWFVVSLGLDEERFEEQRRVCCPRSVQPHSWPPGVSFQHHLSL